MSLTITPSPFLTTDEPCVRVFPMSSELTVAQAAEFLNMSERHLSDLLTAGHIAFRLENGERLVHQNSLVEYEQELERKNAALNELFRLFQEEGLSDD